MKSRLLLIPAILAATAAFASSADALSESLDAQSRAAALLSRPHAPGPSEAYEPAEASSSSASSDARGSAAALLTGRSAGAPEKASVRIASPAAAQRDAHAHAAALLSGSRSTAGERVQITGTGESSGEHPVVLVAKNWTARGIDPNRFIVAHPARLQLLDAVQSE